MADVIIINTQGRMKTLPKKKIIEKGSQSEDEGK